MRCLGIDYGDRHIGIAISDEEGRFAFPKLVISGEWRGISKKIKELVVKENIKTIVVGLPQNFKGTDTQQTKKVRAFAERLQKELGIEVIFENELLTTKAVEHYPSDGGAAPRHMVDASSAALILQSFLDKKRFRHS